MRLPSWLSDEARYRVSLYEQGGFMEALALLPVGWEDRVLEAIRPRKEPEKL